MIPFAFAYLLASVAFALSQGSRLMGEDWLRIILLAGVFALYLAVFMAFGLWASALTHRRVVAFLGLLVVWTVWVFIVPNLAVDIARRLIPVPSFYDLQKQDLALQWDIRTERQTEIDAYRRSNNVENWWSATPEPRQQVLREGEMKIQDKWDSEFYSRLADLQTKRHNQMQNRQHLVAALSVISPFSAVTSASMDLARTGYVQQEQLENGLNAYLISLNAFVKDKRRQATGSIFQGVDLANFTWFIYKDNETLQECLSRNTVHILNLALLAVLGFAGAYVAILRYDVR